jgi:RNA polymerase sigma-70 factor (ECF subfamily)
MKDFERYTDHELIAQMRAGSQAAFKEIFDRYQVPLLNFAAKRFEDVQEVEDVVQEIFIHLWDFRVEFNLNSSLANYLFRATANRILNLVRNRGVRTAYIANLSEYLSKGSNDADFKAREALMQEVIRKEIQTLPPRMREVFGLRHYQYYSNKQIADELGISEQTVETHMKRALKHLRERLGLAVYLLYIYF